MFCGPGWACWGSAYKAVQVFIKVKFVLIRRHCASSYGCCSFFIFRWRCSPVLCILSLSSSWTTTELFILKKNVFLQLPLYKVVLDQMSSKHNCMVAVTWIWSGSRATCCTATCWHHMHAWYKPINVEYSQTLLMQEMQQDICTVCHVKFLSLLAQKH